jgi:hypothetical protein
VTSGEPATVTESIWIAALAVAVAAGKLGIEVVVEGANVLVGLVKIVMLLLAMNGVVDLPVVLIMRLVTVASMMRMMILMRSILALLSKKEDINR